MRFFIDTAKVEDIKKANDMGVKKKKKKKQWGFFLRRYHQPVPDRKRRT